MKQKEGLESCSFLRRMGSILYDSLLLFSVLLFATIPALIVASGETIDQDNRLFQLYLLLISVMYFLIPWKIRGQTLGMQSWKIKLVQETGEKITWGQALKRIMFSLISWLPAGLGFIWSIFDRKKRAWHDYLSSTRLIRLK